AGRAVDEGDVGLRRHESANARTADRVDERAPFAPRELEARLAEARERGRAGRDPDRVRARHAATRASCCGARSANFAKRFRNASFSVPIGPLRCFARMTSARPWSSEFSL